MRGTFGWICDQFIVSLVNVGCCNLLEHKLHSAASSSFFAEYSKNLFAFYERPFLNFELQAWRSKVLFLNPMLYWRIVITMYRISTDRCIPICIDISIYWFTPNGFHMNYSPLKILIQLLYSKNMKKKSFFNGTKTLKDILHSRCN